MTITPEQLRIIAEARGWRFVEDAHEASRMFQRSLRGYWHRDGEGSVNYRDVPAYHTDPALNYELEAEANIETWRDIAEKRWYSAIVGGTCTVNADTPLEARCLAYLAWLEERYGD
jgi:hypothetical protein